MGCARRGVRPDKECKDDFNVCSMLAMGMGSNVSSSTSRPIEDIDIPESPFIIQSGGLENERLGTLQEGFEPQPIDNQLVLNHPEGYQSNGELLNDSSFQNFVTRYVLEFLACLLRLYHCQESGTNVCRNVEQCVPSARDVVESSPDSFGIVESSVFYQGEASQPGKL